ncbi:ABC transporter substrate-binding protein [Kitasatospora sp. NPDC048365]|uniref:ABC transporter substrate-binding protein n=1 Tax=Kitasatospora sp. NPDC048365 TaxID=3364050 RepID=UPI003721F9BD
MASTTPRASRRAFLGAGLASGAVLGLGGLLTACDGSGGNGGSRGRGGGASGAATPQPPAVQQGGDHLAVVERTRGFGTDAAAEVFPRTVTHAMGSTVIPARPVRVVVLDTGELDNVVALGVQPVGAAYADGSTAVPAYLKDRAGNPAPVGTVSGIDLGAVAALKPDLILGSTLRAQDQYAALSKIAPTVFSIRPGYPWKENFALNAVPFGLEAEARAQLDAYRRTAGEIGRTLGGRKPTVSPLRFMPGRIRLYTGLSFIGTVLADVPLPQPRIEQVKELAVEVGPEQIEQADADWVFYGSYGPPSSTGQDAVLGGARWKSLGAVKSGRVRQVSDETWYLGLGVLAAGAVLADLKASVASGA